MNKNIWNYRFIIQRKNGSFDSLSVETDRGEKFARKILQDHIEWLEENTPLYLNPTGLFIFDGRTLVQKRKERV